MPEITIPLVGSPDLRNQDAYTSIAKGQRFIGCVFDVIKNPVTGAGRVYCSKRTGIEATSTPAAGVAGRAISEDGSVQVFSTTAYYAGASCGTVSSTIYPTIPTATINEEKVWLLSFNQSGYFLATGALSGGSTFTANRTAASTTLSSVSSFTGLYVGQLLSGTGIDAAARIASLNSGASTLEMTVAASSGAGTSTTVTRERLAKIIDADFPATPGGPMVEIDGYVFVGDSDTPRIYNSDPNSVVSWSAASYLSLNSNSGVVAGCAKYRGRLVGFGGQGYEFFYNAGNSTGSPFTRTVDSSGVACGGTYQTGVKFIAQGDDYLVWEDDSGSVYMMDGAQAKEITTPAIKRVASTGNKHISVSLLFGKKHVHICNSSSYSFLYDIELGVWSESGFPSTLVLSGLDSQAALASTSYAIDVVGTSGKLYKFDQVTPSYQDDGASYTMTIQTAGLDLGSGNRKTVEFYELDSDVQSSGTATLKVCDDDSGTFTTVGTFDMTKVNPRIYRGGSWKGKRQFQITHSDNTAFRASQLRIKFTVGAH